MYSGYVVAQYVVGAVREPPSFVTNPTFDSPISLWKGGMDSDVFRSGPH